MSIALRYEHPPAFNYSIQQSTAFRTNSLNFHITPFRTGISELSLNSFFVFSLVKDNELSPKDSGVLSQSISSFGIFLRVSEPITFI